MLGIQLSGRPFAYRHALACMYLRYSILNTPKTVKREQAQKWTFFKILTVCSLVSFCAAQHGAHQGPGKDGEEHMRPDP